MTDLAKTLCSTLEAALDRATGERELARQNDELARLDRLNGLIRDVIETLVSGESRAEIDRSVCEGLTASDRYRFAWIGEHDPTTGTITPREWAGVDSRFVDDLAIPVDETMADRSPAVAALRRGETQVAGDIATETGFAPLRQETLERGARSWTCVPLAFEESNYGVLSIYADQPQPDARDLAVLSELGETVAYALSALETRETLRTDRVVELTLQLEHPTTPLCRLARETGCEFGFEGLVQQPGNESDVYFTATGISPESLVSPGEQSVAITELVCISEHEEYALFRARVSEPTLASRFVEQDAVIRRLRIDAESATAVVDLPHTADVRGFVDAMRETVPEVELLTRKTRSRSLKTRRTFRSICDERLTVRQQAALQTAYLSGFFESPRVRTGQQVAASLGVSQPTFTNHLRAAERAIFEVLFEEADPPIRATASEGAD
ncbi:MAG: bacterio-opsin activator domain-containing protein [Halalkalicoccus sp.]